MGKDGKESSDVFKKLDKLCNSSSKHEVDVKPVDGVVKLYIKCKSCKSRECKCSSSSSSSCSSSSSSSSSCSSSSSSSSSSSCCCSSSSSSSSSSSCCCSSSSSSSSSSSCCCSSSSSSSSSSKLYGYQYKWGRRGLCLDKKAYVCRRKKHGKLECKCRKIKHRRAFAFIKPERSCEWWSSEDRRWW